MKIHTDVRPWLDYGNTLAKEFRESEKGVEFELAGYDLLQWGANAPVKRAGVCKLIPSRKRCRGDPIPQEIAEQCMNRLHCRRMTAQNTGLGPPAEFGQVVWVLVQFLFSLLVSNVLASKFRAKLRLAGNSRNPACPSVEKRAAHRSSAKRLAGRFGAVHSWCRRRTKRGKYRFRKIVIATG